MVQTTTEAASSQATIYNLYSKLHILLASVLPTAMGYNLQTVFSCSELSQFNRTAAYSSDKKLTADEDGMNCMILYTKEVIILSSAVHTMKKCIQFIHAKAKSVSSLQLNVSAGPIPANSTVAVFPLTVTPPLIKWVVQKEGSELISNLLSIACSSWLLVAATRSTYLPGSRSVNDTLPEEPEWVEDGGLHSLEFTIQAGKIVIATCQDYN